MDRNYFRSKQFAIATLLALLVLGGGAAALAGGVLGHSTYTFPGCADRTPEGEPLAATRNMQTQGNLLTITYTLDIGDATAGEFNLCAGAGDLTVIPATGNSITLEARVTNPTEADLAGTGVRAAFANDAGQVRVAAWEGPHTAKGSLIANMPQTDLVLHLPDHLVYTGAGRTSLGDISVGAIRTANLTLQTSGGRVATTGLLAEGNVDARTSWGDVDLAFASVQTARIEARSSSGDVDVRLPARADIGYNATARSSAGDITIRIEDAEQYDRSSRGTTMVVRSANYDARPTQVEVDVRTSSGDIRIRTI